MTWPILASADVGFQEDDSSLWIQKAAAQRFCHPVIVLMGRKCYVNAREFKTSLVNQEQ